MKNIELSTSQLVARQLMENCNYMVNTEEEMAFDHLTNMTFWRKNNELLPKMTMFGSKPKQKYISGNYC